MDVTAARKAGIAAILTSVIGVLADLGYLGWDEAVITGRRKPRGKEMTTTRATKPAAGPELPAASASAATPG